MENIIVETCSRCAASVTFPRYPPDVDLSTCLREWGTPSDQALATFRDRQANIASSWIICQQEMRSLKAVLKRLTSIKEYYEGLQDRYRSISLNIRRVPTEILTEASESESIAFGLAAGDGARAEHGVANDHSEALQES